MWQLCKWGLVLGRLLQPVSALQGSLNAADTALSVYRTKRLDVIMPQRKQGPS
jgi:hypothetical protein